MVSVIGNTYPLNHLKFSRAQLEEIKNYLQGGPSGGSIPSFVGTSKVALGRFTSRLAKWRLVPSSAPITEKRSDSDSDQSDRDVLNEEGKIVIAREDIPGVLQRLYDNPETSANGRDRFYYKIAKDYAGVSKADVLAFLKTQEAYQLHRIPPKRKTVLPIVVKGPGKYWQVDTIMMRERDRPGPLPHANKGIQYIVCIIDVFSKFAWALPVRKLGDVSKAFEELLSMLLRNRDIPSVIQTDQGTEFNNEAFKGVLDSFGIRHITSRSHTPQSQGIVERINRTLKSAINVHMTKTGSKKYIDALPAILKGYNSARHTTTGFAPEETNSKSIAKISSRLTLRKNRFLASTNGRIEKPSVGDFVRISLEAIDPKVRSAKLTGIGRLAKSTGVNYTREVFKVSGVRGGRYRLEGINGSFLSSELLRVVAPVAPGAPDSPKPQEKTVENPPQKPLRNHSKEPIRRSSRKKTPNVLLRDFVV